MTWEDVVAMNRPEAPASPAKPAPESCGDTVGWGYEDTISCEKSKGHDDPRAEIAGRRTDPIHQRVLEGDPNLTVTWHR